LIRPDITLRRAGINSGPPAAYLSCTTKVVMHMIDWNTYRQQVVAGVGGFAKLSPETVKGYGAMVALDRRPASSTRKPVS
jgi:3-oxoacyl-(acyl-carrier-protein) synthase